VILCLKVTLFIYVENDFLQRTFVQTNTKRFNLPPSMSTQSGKMGISQELML